MPASGPHEVAFTVHGPIARSDLSGLCRRVCSVLEGFEGADVVCDVCGVDPDAVTVDALARLQLAAHRRRCRILLRNASVELNELVRFMGLEDVLPER